MNLVRPRNGCLAAAALAWALFPGALLLDGRAVARAIPHLAVFAAAHAAIGALVACGWPWPPRQRGVRVLVRLGIGFVVAVISYFAGLVLVFVFGSPGNEL